MNLQSQPERLPPSAYSVRVTFTFPADLEQIPSVVERFAEVALANGYDGERELELRLATQEALANAVVHGNGCDPGKQVHCLMALDAKLGLLLTIRDEGSGFRESAVPSPLEEDGLQASHGRGLHLLRTLMDDVWFEHNGTQISFRKFTGRPESGGHGAVHF